MFIRKPRVEQGSSTCWKFSVHLSGCIKINYIKLLMTNYLRLIHEYKENIDSDNKINYICKHAHTHTVNSKVKKLNLLWYGILHYN